MKLVEERIARCQPASGETLVVAPNNLYLEVCTRGSNVAAMVNGDVEAISYPEREAWQQTND